MPQVLKELLDERTQTKRQMKKARGRRERFLDAKQYAMKILLNSFYGYSGYARARLYSLASGQCRDELWPREHRQHQKIIDEIGSVYVVDGDVVLKGCDLIFGKSVAKGFDLSVVYGDTDSVFVRLKPLEGRR